MTLVDGLVGLFLACLLLENREPILPVAAMAVISLRGLTSRVVRGLGFKAVEWSVVGCVTYWLANYFWSVGDLRNLVSFQFLRNDGAPLVTYPLLIFFLGWPMKERFLRGYWVLVVFVFASIGFIGTALSLRFPYSEAIFGWMNLISYDEHLQANVFYGWYRAHNTIGGMFALISLVPLAILQVERSNWRGRLVASAFLFCCLLGLLLTYSRGSYLGFLVGAVFIIPIRKLGKVARIAILAGIPLLTVLLFTSSVMNRIDTIIDLNPVYGRNADRFRIWANALRDIERSPIIGIGFSRFNDYMLDFKGQRGLVDVAVGGMIENNDSHAHNSYLHFLAEGGIVGLALSLDIWWFAWKELSLWQRKLPKSKLKALHCAAKAWIPATLMLSMTEHILGRGTVIMALMALVGTVIAGSRAEWAVLMEAREAEERKKVELIRRTSLRPVFSRFEPHAGTRR